MPKIENDTIDYTCWLCGSKALFVSHNSKKTRCQEKITKCPGFIKKAETTRQQRISTEERKMHMKKMSMLGNSALKKLHDDMGWVNEKSQKISESVKKRGGHRGKNNPMFGRKHSLSSLEKLVDRANSRDHQSYLQATQTKISKGLAIPKEQKNEWELYREQVTNYTYQSWKYHQDKINPQCLVRGQDYELDHKFSITEGFRRGVEPEVIGHYSNLELISKEDNRSKRTRCSISLDELYENYKKT